MNAMKLKRVLLGNAAFSFISGLLMIAINRIITSLFGLENGLIFYILGAGLIVFAAHVRHTAKRKLENKKQVLSISIADFIWVVGSLAIIGTSTFQLTQLGYIIIGFVAFIVLLFGILQLKFNR